MTVVDYRALCGMPETGRVAWVERERPHSGSPQWALSVIESVETHASVSTRRAGGLDLPAFDFAVWFLQTSVRLGDLTPSYAAYWLLRFAAVAQRAPHHGLPDLLRPDRVARHTIESFPLTLERYREVSVKWAREADEDKPADEEFRLMQDVSWTLPSLAWVRDAIVDPMLRDEVDTWLAAH